MQTRLQGFHESGPNQIMCDTLDQTKGFHQVRPNKTGWGSPDNFEQFYS